MTNVVQDEIPHFENTVEGCLETVRQCIHLAKAVSPEAFISTPHQSSSIGAHLRHCLEHFVEFQKGFDESHIHYDHRERSPEVESNQELMIERLEEIVAFLDGVHTDDLERKVTVYLTPCRNQIPQAMESTYRRELAFLSCHTIHHVALMKFMAKVLDQNIDEAFGVAYATENHQRFTN